ncbi:MAG: hypothetical protein ACOY4R_27835 [Pseudomonadota bacterium]
MADDTQLAYNMPPDLTGPHRERAAQYGSQYDEAVAQRQAAIDRANAILEETTAALKAARSGPSVNLPLLALGAGMLSSNGNFGQQLGSGLRAAIPALAAQRAEQDDYQMQLANLALKRAGLEQAPLQDKMAYLRAMQLGELQSIKDIERVQARAQAGGGGADPALVKEWRIWAAPGTPNEGQPFEKYLEFKARTGADRNTPASLREFDEWRKANPEGTFEDFLQTKAQRAATGREKGQEQAKAQQALPGIAATAERMLQGVDRIAAHPGLEKATGWKSVFPSVPGNDAANFEALVDSLKGQAFLTMFDQLRGGGAITEAEGKKATDALAALSLTQSPAQFREQLDIVRSVVRKGLEAARQRAGQQPSPEGTPQVARPEEAPPASPASPAYKDGDIADGPNGQTLIRRGGKWVPYDGR